jgi:cyclic pyranopterin phosphate synthase
MALVDLLGRPVRDLRVSVTDRCNFRCTYCMPREVFGPDYQFLERRELLTYEEIARLTRLFVAHGVSKVRITGGEPLVRRNLDQLVVQLGGLEGLEDLTLTTNGSLLAVQAERLARAGLKRVTVSLDSLDDSVFRKMNDASVGVETVLEGIEAAAAAGLSPIKVNAVVERGVNDHTMVELAAYFRRSGHILRFIEFMDVGTTNGWRLDNVVPAEEMIERIDRVFPIEPLDRNYPGEVAERWRYSDGGGEIGFITSITRPFCSTCTRARLSPEGQLFTCLFGATGYDLRGPLRAGADDEEMARHIAAAWSSRSDRYSERRAAATANLPRVEMSHIGG